MRSSEFQLKPLLMIVCVAALCGNTPPTSRPAAELSLPELNVALKQSPLDPQLNYFAGLSYETTSVAGTEQRELARTGYLMALKSDPAFWPAHVQLAHLAMEDRDAIKAQHHFVEAALIHPSEPEVFYGLARAAYVSGDLPLAMSAYHRALNLAEPNVAEHIATGAAIFGRSGNRSRGQEFYEKLKNRGVALSPMLAQALRSDAPDTRPNVIAPPISSVTDSPAMTSLPNSPVSNKLGMVDVIILRRDEAIGSSNGINLLDALSLQFGGSLINARWVTSRDRQSGELTTNTFDWTRELSATIPSVTYSLNIANSRDGWSTVQTQQALLIYDGEISKVRLGDSITYATDGDFNSSVGTKDAGLTLEIKSNFIAADTVKVAVSANVEDFVDGRAVGTFRQAVQSAKATTDVVAELKFGETIMISSGEHVVNARGSTRTPILSDMPLVGELFRARTKLKTTSSILMLLTLRPRGSEKLPHFDERERRWFESMKKRLLEQIDPEADYSHFENFIPDARTMSYKLYNPAKVRDQEYFRRAGLLGF